MGTTSDFQSGIVPCAVEDILRKKQELQEQNVQVTIELSYLEIYMEDCFDLLTKDQEKRKLDLRETSGGETYLDGLTSMPIHSLADVVTYISMANKTRSTGKTAMNSHSSRSHAICTLTLRVTRETASFVSKLNLVDLAGSERVKKTMATGDALQEGISINKGLLALGNVVSALSMRSINLGSNNSGANSEKAKDGSNTGNSHIHIPYRESKLTRLLKDSLGGNGMTVLLACLSPAASNYDESLNTLRFASRASAIVNSAKVNLDGSAGMSDAGHLMKEVARLREHLSVLQGKYDNLLASAASSSANTLSAAHAASHSMLAKSKKAAGEELSRYVQASQKLAAALKSLLMLCFEEDVAVDEEEVRAIQRDFRLIRSCLDLDEYVPSANSGGGLMNLSGLEQCSFLLDDGNAQDLLQQLNLNLLQDNCIPPLLQAIDEAKHLETCLAGLAREKPGSKNKALPAIADSDRLPLPTPSNDDSTCSSASSHKRKFSQLSSDNDQDSSSDKDKHDDSLDISEIMADQVDAPAPADQLHNVSFFSVDDDQACSADAAAAAADRADFINVKASLVAKEQRINSMASLAEQYELTIRQLHEEITALEQEKQQLVSQEQDLQHKTSNSNNRDKDRDRDRDRDGDDKDKVKQLLRQKSKLLEEKVKVLRAKEVEYNKMCKLKERLSKEVEAMHAQLLTYKKSKVELMKKMREKEQSHVQERDKLLKNDLQSKKQMRSAEVHLQRIENELTNKEKMWRVKLEAKEKESNWLKDLLKKKEDVQQQRLKQREQQGRAKAGGKDKDRERDREAAGGAIGGVGGSLRMKQVSTLLRQEVQREKGNAQLRAKLSFEIDRRRALQSEKIGLKSRLKHQRIGSAQYKALQEEILSKELDIKERSRSVNDLQQQVQSVMQQQLAGCLSSVNVNINSASAGPGVDTASSALSSNSLAQLLSSNGGSAAAILGLCGESASDLRHAVTLLWTMHAQELTDRCKLSLQLADLQQRLKDLDSNDNDNDDEAGADGESEELDGAGDSSAESESADSDVDETFYPSDADADQEKSAGAGRKDRTEEDESDSDGYLKKRKRALAKKRRALGSDDSFSDSDQPASAKTTHAVPGLAKRAVGPAPGSGRKVVKSSSLSSKRMVGILTALDEVSHIVNTNNTNSSSSNNTVKACSSKRQPLAKKNPAASSTSSKPTAPSTADDAATMDDSNTAGSVVSEEEAALAELAAKSRWTKSTVKDLKAELALRHLPVSGVKQELVKRLVVFEQKHPGFEPVRQQAATGSDGHEDRDEQFVENFSPALLNKLNSISSSSNKPSAVSKTSSSNAEFLSPFRDLMHSPLNKHKAADADVSAVGDDTDMSMFREVEQSIQQYNIAHGSDDLNDSSDSHTKKRRLLKAGNQAVLGWFDDQEN